MWSFGFRPPVPFPGMEREPNKRSGSCSFKTSAPMWEETPQLPIASKKPMDGSTEDWPVSRIDPHRPLNKGFSSVSLMGKGSCLYLILPVYYVFWGRRVRDFSSLEQPLPGPQNDLDDTAFRPGCHEGAIPGPHRETIHAYGGQRSSR